jgi:hypothetical protein
VDLFDAGFVHCSLRRLSSVHEHVSLVLQLTRVGVGSNEATKGVIFTYGGVAQGQISDKPKAGVLYQLKDGIYWWASRIIDDFFGLFSKWLTYSVSAIHKAAILEGFETGWREKKNSTWYKSTILEYMPATWSGSQYCAAVLSHASHPALSPTVKTSQPSTKLSPASSVVAHSLTLTP